MALWVLLLLPSFLFAQRTSEDIGVSTKTKPRVKILLIPLDDRPATTQFAEMIGAIASIEVETPPQSYLGRFTTPGQPDRILGWMRSKKLSDYSAVVVNTDMIAYGGLIASRTPYSTVETAVDRLRSLWAIRKTAPNVPFYAFTSLMRLAPTALKNSASWRKPLTDLIVFKSKLGKQLKQSDIDFAAKLRAQIPAGKVSDYYAARDRNHRVQQELLRMVDLKAFDYLILGQDDAQAVGPHIVESKRLQEMVRNLKLEPKTYFCEGIDQHSNVLVCRAILSSLKWSPAVKIVYADQIGRNKIAAYESDRVEASLTDQLEASGAHHVTPLEEPDYLLYLNTPAPREEQFNQFVQNLTDDIDQGFPVAVADINLGVTGTGDKRLFDMLTSTGRSMRLLSYAGWNTAGNTIGTAIPAANVYLAARRIDSAPLERELNQRSFLLHRLVNDFEYHEFTRPLAYKLQVSMGAEKEETYGPDFTRLNDFVRKDVETRLQETFNSQFKGKRFFAGSKQFEIERISKINIKLPWPRAYEVQIQFEIAAQEIVGE